MVKPPMPYQNLKKMTHNSECRAAFTVDLYSMCSLFECISSIHDISASRKGKTSYASHRSLLGV